MWLWGTLAALLVLNPAILVGLLGVAVSMYRGKCSACHLRGPKMQNSTLATVVVNGDRRPDHWAYYVCGKCGARFKWHRGQWAPTGPDDDPFF
jgi:hypothetical protein